MCLIGRRLVLSYAVTFTAFGSCKIMVFVFRVPPFADLAFSPTDGRVLRTSIGVYFSSSIGLLWYF